jgi:hypothetical protein
VRTRRCDARCPTCTRHPDHSSASRRLYQGKTAPTFRRPPDRRAGMCDNVLYLI